MSRYPSCHCWGPFGLPGKDLYLDSKEQVWWGAITGALYGTAPTFDRSVALKAPIEVCLRKSRTLYLGYFCCKIGVVMSI